MREILFRGKRVDNGEWVYGDLINEPYGTVIQYYENEIKDKGNCAKTTNKKRVKATIDPETICQYTGLSDKNGGKIFDGDIILHEMAGKIKVQFEKSEFMVIGIDRTMFLAWLSSIHGNFKIIGNIFDNLELIGE